jgi:hypothetical protein
MQWRLAGGFAHHHADVLNAAVVDLGSTPGQYLALHRRCRPAIRECRARRRRLPDCGLDGPVGDLTVTVLTTRASTNIRGVVAIEGSVLPVGPRPSSTRSVIRLMVSRDTSAPSTSASRC